jgi:hypothetical protein
MLGFRRRIRLGPHRRVGDSGVNTRLLKPNLPNRCRRGVAGAVRFRMRVIRMRVVSQMDEGGQTFAIANFKSLGVQPEVLKLPSKYSQSDTSKGSIPDIGPNTDENGNPI